MQLTVIFGLLLAILSPELIQGQETGKPLQSLLAVWVYTFGTIAIGHLINRWIRNPVLRDVNFCITWFTCIAVNTFLLKWPLLVRDYLELGGLLLIDEGLIVLPAILSLAGGWWFLYREKESPEKATEVVWQKMKFYGAIVLLPALAVGLTRDVITLWSIRDNSWPAWSIYLALSCGLFVITPVLMRFVFETSSIQKTPIGKRLENVALENGVAFRDIRLWDVKGGALNALVIGVIPKLSDFVFSKSLLERLPAQQIEAIMRHEIGHVVRKHMWIRLLILAVPISFYLVATIIFPTTTEFLSESLAVQGVSVEFQINALLPVFAILYTFFAISSISKRLEFEADIFASCRFSSSLSSLEIDNGHLNSYKSALSGIVRSLDPSKRYRDSWLHPSPMQRIAFLGELESTPDIAKRFLRRTSLLVSGIVIWLLISIFACLLVKFIGS